jgi:ATPase subunit of ABC transporter with duplicated ATPase domains
MVREIGDLVLTVKDLKKTDENGQVLFDNLSFTLNKKDKVAILGENSIAVTALLNILSGLSSPDKGTMEWGVTTSMTFVPNDNSSFFTADMDMNLIDWLRQFSEEKDETYIRGFLGRMLFSGEESLKKCHVLSGGEKMRCMFARMIMLRPNVLIFDEPTNHLDLESITALNNGMRDFNGNIIFASRDHELTQTIANRIIEISPKGAIDKEMTYDEYLNNETIKSQREAILV